MNVSAAVVLALLSPVDSFLMTALAPSTKTTFESYTQAWHTAREVERPMLVVLNPPQDAEHGGISVGELQSDEAIQPLLEKYVVAVIDTGTAHGQKVREIFKADTLPRVVVIDKKQEWQVFRSSENLSHERIAKALEQHQDGNSSRPNVEIRWAQQPATSNSYCPSCQRQAWSY